LMKEIKKRGIKVFNPSSLFELKPDCAKKEGNKVVLYYVFHLREPPKRIRKEVEDCLKYVTIEEFKRLDIRVGRIEKVEDIQGSKKLYKLTVSFGNEKRTILAGLKGIKKKEDLEGKQVIVLKNLLPRKMLGLYSEGMLLALEDGTLIVPEREVKPNSKVM